MNVYSVNGVRDRCRSLDQFFIEEEFYLLIFHFLLTHLYLLISYFSIIMKTFLERSFHIAGVGESL